MISDALRHFMHTTLRTTARLLVALLAISSLGLGTVAAQQSSVPTPAPQQFPDYTIGSTDVLRLVVQSGGVLQPDFSQREYTVQNDGAIQVPLLDAPVRVVGMKPREAGAAIRRALIDSHKFSDVTVEVTVAVYRASKIVIRGAVRTPGLQQMTFDRLNMNDALNAAGGLTANAGTEIRVKRFVTQPPNPEVRMSADGWELYTAEDLYQGRLSDVKLYENDIVDVPVAPKFIVNGFVVTPGEYQWEPNLTLERAILKAGGVNPQGAKNRVQLRRLDPKTGLYADIDFKKQFKGIDKFSVQIEPKDIIIIPKRRI